MHPYIFPTTKVHSSFAQASEYYDTYGAMQLFEEKRVLKFSDLAQGKRNLIVGEPGIGKTLLLGKIQDQLSANGYATEFVSLRKDDALHRIDSFLGSSAAPKALLLDALDEVKGNVFPSIIEKLEGISRNHADVAIYLSSRWVFIKRHAAAFPEYRYVTISPFSRKQVRDYLVQMGHPDDDIEDLLRRVMSFSHQMLVLQIPRYLSYLERFLEDRGVVAAAKVSRNELFEYFIYAKLAHEDTKVTADRKAITKRLLEKLALVMEVYQTNVLLMDEFMTFLDETQSDFKLVALAQMTLEDFFNYSLLKNNIDSIEFENTEFQEYLAAKEITRFTDPMRAAFALAVDRDINEIYPTWYNALTFLVDMQPDLLEPFVEFSALRGTEFKVVDKSFFTFISRIDPRAVAVPLRRQLFTDLLSYHERALQWMPDDLASALPAFFDTTLEPLLKDKANLAERQQDTKRFVPLGNIAYVVAYLLEGRVPIDHDYWREKLVVYTADANTNGVLQRHALFALGKLGDPSVIDRVPNLMNAEELVARAYLSMLAEIDPDNSTSLACFVEATKRDAIEGRYGLHAIKKAQSLKEFLRAFISDEYFRREFLDDTKIFEEQDQVLIDHISAVLDNELRDLAEDALVQSLDYETAYGSERSVFTTGLWKILRQSEAGFVSRMIDRVRRSPNPRATLLFSHQFFAEVIEAEDIPNFIDGMKAAGEDRSALSVMQLVKLSGRPEADAIYEAGRSCFPEQYRQWEEHSAQRRAASGDAGKRLLEEFRNRLDPEPGKFSHSVFSFYNGHASDLDPLFELKDRDRLVGLITGTVFKLVNPATHDLRITEESGGAKQYTMSSAIRLFRDALIAANRLKIDVRPYRQQILNFIPFSHSEELRVIFDIIKDVKASEMQAVLGVYRKRRSDLWRHLPSSFIDAVEQYHVAEAAPILKEFVTEPAFDSFVRHRALSVLDSIAPDPAFLEEIFERYNTVADENQQSLANVANGLLIASHTNAAAIRWRLKEVAVRVAAPSRPPGHARISRTVSDLENETFGKTFAKPLMELKERGFEADFLDLLGEAIRIWGGGNEFRAYAQYLWEIVSSYFDNLKDCRSYLPLRQLEAKIAKIKDEDGANWLAARMVRVRQSYLAYLGKPRNVSEAVKKYNEVRSFDDKKIRNSDELFRHLQDALATDLRRWIEGEGAYSLILGKKVFSSKKQEYEKLVQKTLKAHLETIFLRRGLQVDIGREPQLYDEKRADFVIRYGFVGPIVLEVKLTSNTDLKAKRMQASASYSSMQRYMQGYGASHGIFLVVDNVGAKNLPKVTETFQQIPNVWVQAVDCYHSFRPTEVGKGMTRRKRRSRRSA